MENISDRSRIGTCQEIKGKTPGQRINYNPHRLFLRSNPVGLLFFESHAHDENKANASRCINSRDTALPVYFQGRGKPPRQANPSARDRAAPARTGGSHGQLRPPDCQRNSKQYRASATAAALHRKDQVNLETPRAVWLLLFGCQAMLIVGCAVAQVPHLHP